MGTLELLRYELSVFYIMRWNYKCLLYLDEVLDIANTNFDENLLQFNSLHMKNIYKLIEGNSIQYTKLSISSGNKEIDDLCAKIHYANPKTPSAMKDIKSMVTNLETLLKIKIQSRKVLFELD